MVVLSVNPTLVRIYEHTEKIPEKDLEKSNNQEPL